MVKGGARARSGPAPDPMALRPVQGAGDWTVLPAAGRQGATPDWPLVEQTYRESTLWEALWCKPQAMMWDRLGQELEVALYVRRLAEAELVDSRVTLTTIVKQMADSLGLTTPGLRANRWRIDPGEDDAPPAPTGGPSTSPMPPSARDRLKVVPGGGA